jgi:hypothetical protein
MIKEAENVCYQCADAAKTGRANDFTGNLSKEALYQVSLLGFTGHLESGQNQPSSAVSPVCP